MLCAECRLFYKKYGIDRVIENRPETPAALRELRERLKPVEPVNQEVEMDFGLTNQDDSSQPAQPVVPEPEPTPVQTKSEVEPPPVIKPEPKLEVKPEFKPEQVPIPVPVTVPAVIKDEPEEIKRKIQNENHEEEPQNKKSKHDPIAKKESVVTVRAVKPTGGVPNKNQKTLFGKCSNRAYLFLMGTPAKKLFLK